MRFFWAPLALAAAACTRPAPPSATTVYDVLVAAGCMAPAPDGPQAVADQHGAGDTPWLECLYDGGTVPSCGVPCDASASRRP